MRTELVRLAASKSGSSSGSYVFLLIIVVVLVFFFTASRRRQRATAQTQGSIRPGSEVMTTAGLYGTVTGIDDEGLILLEVAPGIVLRFARGAISRVLSSGPPDEATALEDEDAYAEDHEVDGDQVDEDEYEDDGDDVDGPDAEHEDADETAEHEGEHHDGTKDGDSPPKKL